MVEAPKPGPRSLPFSQGLAWMLQSLALIRLQFTRLLLIAAMLQVLLYLTRLPVIGFLIILSVPLFTAGILAAFHVTAAGGRPRPGLLFKPLSVTERAGRLLGLGAVLFAVGVLSVLLVLGGMEGTVPQELLVRLEQGDLQAVAELDQGVVARLVAAFAVGVSVSGTLSYFSIPLIWFGGHRLGSALAAGLRALLVNWRPFLLLAVGLVALLLPIMLVTGILMVVAAAGGIVSILATVFIMILLLAFQMLLFGTQYCAYQDVFGRLEAERPPPTDEDGQLLA